MSPEFEKLSEECASNEVIFAKVNIDDFQSVAEKNNITGVRRILDGFRSDMTLIPAINF